MNKVISKLNSIPLFFQILSGYILIVLPFLYFHEDHLPLGLATILIASTLLFSVICLILTIVILRILYQKNFDLLYEIVFLALILGSLYFVHFFESVGSVILVSIVVSLSILFRFLKVTLYHQITLIGLSILSIIFLTFQFMQFSELFLFQKMMDSKYKSVQKELNNWTIDEKDRTVTNSDLSIKFKLPDDLFFHKPNQIQKEEKLGIGELVGIVSASNKDSSTYPYIRIFLFQMDSPIDRESLKKEYEVYLELMKNRNDVQEIKWLGTHIHETQKWEGNFWSFYDVLRPRYAKIGFYLFPLDKGIFVLIDVMENLTTTTFHEEKIRQLLDSCEFK